MRSSRICSALWITFFAVWMYTSPSESLKCYECNSVDDENCEELKGNEYLIDCENSTNVFCMNHTNCRKQTFSAESRAYNWKVQRVVRTCGCERHPKYDCFYSSTVDLKSTTCECEEDKCNVGQNLTPTMTMLSSLIMFGLLLIT